MLAVWSDDTDTTNDMMTTDNNEVATITSCSLITSIIQVALNLVVAHLPSRQLSTLLECPLVWHYTFAVQPDEGTSCVKKLPSKGKNALLSRAQKWVILGLYSSGRTFSTGSS